MARSSRIPGILSRRLILLILLVICALSSGIWRITYFRPEINSLQNIKALYYHSIVKNTSTADVIPPRNPSISSSIDLSSGTTSGAQVKTRPLVIAVTPTYNRPAQAIHVSQVVNVLRLVPPPLLWIVVESYEKSKETAQLLERTAGRCIFVGSYHECTAINYIHISSGVYHENHAKSRGVNQRNAALDYIEENRIDGIVYFMDDDNSYTPDLFEEIRKIQRVGVMPVGFLWSAETSKVTGRAFLPYVERPLVKKGRVIGWETFNWAASMDPNEARKYQTDMAGYAFRSTLLWREPNVITGRPKRPVRFRSKPMFIESLFLDQLVSGLSELDPLADSCQDVLVWHTRLESGYNDPYPANWRIKQPKNLVIDIYNNHTARYIVRQRRAYLKDYNGTLPFGYKSMPQFVPRNSENPS